MQLQSITGDRRGTSVPQSPTDVTLCQVQLDMESQRGIQAHLYLVASQFVMPASAQLGSQSQGMDPPVVRNVLLVWYAYYLAILGISNSFIL